MPIQGCSIFFFLLILFIYFFNGESNYILKLSKNFTNYIVFKNTFYVADVSNSVSSQGDLKKEN